VRIFICFIAATALLGATGCGGGSDSVPKDAIAVVGDETVMKEELDQVLAQARANAKESGRPFPKKGTPQYRQIRDQLVQYLVRRAQLAAAAEERGIEISDEEIDQRPKLLVGQYYGGSEKRYREALKKEGLSEEQACADHEASLVQQELFKDVGKDVKVTDAELRKHYEKNKLRYATEARRQIRQILLRKDQRALAERHRGLEARRPRAERRHEAGHRVQERRGRADHELRQVGPIVIRPASAGAPGRLDF
jgi:parvulin-like peptidyl-prolyl isomerase